MREGLQQQWFERRQGKGVEIADQNTVQATELACQPKLGQPAVNSIQRLPHVLDKQDAVMGLQFIRRSQRGANQ
ncbi:hypothetical protein D9M73_250910 [compost metagenome]